MASPTLTQIYTRTRAVLGDDLVSGGELYTDAVLLPHIQNAVRDLFRCLRNLSEPKIIREKFVNLPANTTAFDPRQNQMADLVAPSSLEERGNVTTVSVTALSLSGTSVVITAAGHGRSVGDQVVLHGAFGGVTNVYGLWAASAVAGNDITISGLGAIVTGTYTSGGSVSYSTEEFLPMNYVRRIRHISPSGANLVEWSWSDRLLRFAPCTSLRQLKINYWSTAPDPTTGADIVDVEDSLDFIAHQSASYACATRMPTVSAQLRERACGPKGHPDGSGGQLQDLVLAAVRTMQELDPSERTRAGFRDTYYQEFEFF